MSFQHIAQKYNATTIECINIGIKMWGKIYLDDKEEFRARLSLLQEDYMHNNNPLIITNNCFRGHSSVVVEDQKFDEYMAMNLAILSAAASGIPLRDEIDNVFRRKGRYTISMPFTKPTVGELMDGLETISILLGATLGTPEECPTIDIINPQRINGIVIVSRYKDILGDIASALSSRWPNASIAAYSLEKRKGLFRRLLEHLFPSQKDSYTKTYWSPSPIYGFFVVRLEWTDVLEALARRIDSENWEEHYITLKGLVEEIYG